MSDFHMSTIVHIGGTNIDVLDGGDDLNVLTIDKYVMISGSVQDFKRLADAIFAYLASKSKEGQTHEVS